MSRSEKTFTYDVVSDSGCIYNYDAWLLWVIQDRCNLNCNYCFCFDSDAKKNGTIFSINIPALIQTLNKTNKTFRIGFTGGEPFLTPNIIEACIEITKKHYISLNSNLTTTKLKEFSVKINPKKVIHITASLHIVELETYNLMDRFIDNYMLLKEKGFNINALEVAHPSLLNHVHRYKDLFKEKGFNISFCPFVGEYDGKKYPDSYTSKEINIFDLKDTVKLFNQKGRLCNAGYNVGIILQNGDVVSCFSISKKIGNIYKDIEFKDQLIICPVEVCGCPLKCYDKNLFQKALKENKISEGRPAGRLKLGWMSFFKTLLIGSRIK